MLEEEGYRQQIGITVNIKPVDVQGCSGHAISEHNILFDLSLRNHQAL